MLNLLFSPSGRIGSSEFMKGAIILVVIAVLLSLPSVLGMSQSVVMLIGLLSYVLYYCWVALWIKRYHDGGKSGFMCLIPIGVYLVLGIILMVVFLGGDIMSLAQASVDGASQSETTAMTESMMAEKTLPLTVGGAVLSLAVAFLFNAMIKSDPHENQFGPATGS